MADCEEEKLKIDHIAITTPDPPAAAMWYSENYGAEIVYSDKTWAFVAFENVKLAFVVPEQHPPHFAFEVDILEGGDIHRDGSRSVYKKDPWGNNFELVIYPKEGDQD